MSSDKQRELDRQELLESGVHAKAIKAAIEELLSREQGRSPELLPEYVEMRRALMALRLEVVPSIMDAVDAKFSALMKRLSREPAQPQPQLATMSAQEDLTIGGLIKALEAMPQDAPAAIRTDAGLVYPERLTSYRGYYEHLAVVPCEIPMTVGDFLKMCRDAIGKVFEGYKGGYYTCDKYCEMYVADYGGTGPRLVLAAQPQPEPAEVKP